MCGRCSYSKEGIVHVLVSGTKAASVADLLLLRSRKSLWNVTELRCHLLIQTLGLEAWHCQLIHAKKCKMRHYCVTLMTGEGAR